jgi:cholesterol oxidase
VLGVVITPTLTVLDEVNREVAEEMGVGDTFTMAPVGVFFGVEGKKPGLEVNDPYFGGVGPRRTGRLECGECMTGCRHNAKNTLVKNDLYLAERAGAVVYPDTTATSLRAVGDGGYAVDTSPSGAWWPDKHLGRCSWTAGQVVLAAGTWGSRCSTG